MKSFFLTFLAFSWAAVMALGADPKSQGDSSSAAQTPAAASDASTESALQFYKQRAADGAHPTLVIRNGELAVADHQEKQAASGAESNAGDLIRQGVKSLEAQLKALQDKNAELEKALRECKGGK